MSKDGDNLAQAAMALGGAHGQVIRAERYADKISNGETGRAGLRDLLDKLGNVETAVHQMQNELRRRLAKTPDPKPRPLFDGNGKG